MYPLDNKEEPGLQSDKEDGMQHPKKPCKAKSTKAKLATKPSKAIISHDELFDVANTSMADLGLSSRQEIGLISDKSMVSLFSDGEIVFLSPSCFNAFLSKRRGDGDGLFDGTSDFGFR